MKKLFRVIPLTITLTLLIIALVFNLTSKTIMQEIKDETWKAIVPESLQKSDEKGSNWFQDIMNNESVKGFIDQYIDTDKIKETINDVKETAAEEIEKAVDEFIEEQEKKLSPGQRFALNMYRFITNAKMKGILMILIGINILLMALALWSFVKWIKPTSWALALSGLSILLLTEWLRNTIESLIHVTTITYRALTLPGIILLISGIVIRFIYFVIASIIKANKKEKKNEKKEEDADDLS